MAIDFQCAACGKRYRVADALAGRRAKCACGAATQIPQAELEISGGLASLLDEELVGEAAIDREGVAQKESAKKRAESELRGAIERFNPGRLPYQKMLQSVLRNGSPRALQMLAAIGVGAGVGFSGASKMANATTVMLVSGALGGVALGAAAGAVLWGYDAVKLRKASRRRVPMIANLFLGKGILSVAMWVVAAFVGALLFVCYLAATTPGAQPW